MLVRECWQSWVQIVLKDDGLALYMKKPDRCTPLEFEFWLAGKNLNPYLKGELFSLIIKRYAKLKELQLPYGPEGESDGVLLHGEQERIERTVIRGWIDQWLKSLLWQVAMDLNTPLMELLDYPIVETTWCRQSEIKRFGALWKVLDMARRGYRGQPRILAASTGSINLTSLLPHLK